MSLSLPLFDLNYQQSRMRATRLKAQADSKNAALSLLEGRLAESEKTRKDHEDRMKFKIELLEQVTTTLRILLNLIQLHFIHHIVISLSI